MPAVGGSTTLQALRNQATVIQWNARGLRSRLSDLRQLVTKHRFPVIAISESRLTVDVRISGYALYRSQTGTEQSRVLLAVRSDLTCVLHNVPPDVSNEYVAATVKHRSVAFSVVAGYIPPHARFDAKRLEALLDSTPPPHVLTGDFNAHHPAWGGTKTSVRGRRLLNVASQAGLVVLNTGCPTFYCGQRSSALDVTMVSAPFCPPRPGALT